MHARGSLSHDAVCKQLVAPSSADAESRPIILLQSAASGVLHELVAPLQFE